MPSRKRSRLWFDLHSWIGLKLTLFMSFVLITGTLAVISNELDWLTHDSMRVEPQTMSERASWGDIYAALHTAHPQWQFSYIVEPIDPWFSVLVYAQTPQGQRRLVDVDPYKAEVRGDRHWMSFQRFFRNIHRHLMLPVKIGVPLVSALSLPMILSMISGLIIYKKFWRGFFNVPRRGRNTRIFNGDLHRLLGLWSLWFLIVISASSVFYLAESLGWQAPPFGKLQQAAQAEFQLEATDIDRYAERAHEVLPGFRIAALQLPTQPGRPLVFQGYTDGTWLVRPRASYVAFDPANGELLGSHRSSDANLHQRISEMADPLHFGYFGGITTKLTWFVFGLGLSALSITGVIIYAKRLQKSHTANKEAQPSSGPWAIAWQGMGYWKWIGVAVIVVALALTPIEAMACLPSL